MIIFLNKYIKNKLNRFSSQQIFTQIMNIGGNQFHKVCHKHNYTLYICYSKNNTIRLRVLLQASKIKTKTYQLEIASLNDYGMLAGYCRSYQNVVKLLQQPDNIQFNAEESCMVLTETNRFGMKIQLANFKFQYLSIMPENNDKKIEQLIQRCLNKNQLSSSETKQILQSISSMVLWMYQELKRQKIQKSNIQVKQKQINIQNFSINRLKRQQMQISQQKIIQIQTQIHQIKKQIQKLNELKIKCQDFQSKLLQIAGNYNSSVFKPDNQFRDLTSRKIQRTQDKLITLSEQLQSRMQKINQRLNNTQLALDLNPKYTPINASSFVHSDSAKYNSMKLMGNQITNISNECTYVYSKIVVKRKQTFVFKCTYLGEFLILGIVDLQFINQMTDTNFFGYCSDGRCFVGINKKFQESTKGFKVAEEVQMIVDVMQGIIQWRVAGETRKSVISPRIKDPKINWAPIIYFQSKDASLFIYR